jgi:hypothetical protein
VLEHSESIHERSHLAHHTPFILFAQKTQMLCPGPQMVGRLTLQSPGRRSAPRIAPFVEFFLLEKLAGLAFFRSAGVAWR